jgi:pyrroline-5-carboxylate reductase
VKDKTFAFCLFTFSFKMSSIAFLGAGAMGAALMRGLLKAQVYAPQEIRAFDVDAARVQALADELGLVACASPATLCEGADVIVAAVKPQVMLKALEPLRDTVTSQQLLISIAPGLSTSQLEACFSQAVPVLRVMPNTPCLVGQGAAAIARGAHATDEHRALGHKIFAAVGLAVDVEEKLLDAVTGLSGSGPAYVYVFIEALSDAGVRMGLARDAATRLAAQTVLGAAQMVLETGTHPGALKDQVTSPGGTTIAGLHELERHALRGAVMDAVQAATNRARELSGN